MLLLNIYILEIAIFKVGRLVGEGGASTLGVRRSQFILQGLK